MFNKKTTKRALGSSILALVLCFAMLLGTTYAWFTDSVTSANNVIKSGNLDIELEYLKNGEWVDVKDASDILTNELWEPGVTEVAYFRIANAGSLALKYQFGINIVKETSGVNVAGEKFLLSDYIQFGVVEGVNGKTAAYADREAAVAAVTDAKKISAGYTKASNMESGDEIYLALVVYMPTSVGNVANHDGVNVPVINLGINIFATQYTYEEDSYGKDYDDGAYIPVAPETAEQGEDLVLHGSAESKTTVKVPANVAEALKEAGATGLSVKASAPVVDTANKTVNYSTVELVDQNGNEVDIAATGAKVTVKLFVGDAFADGEQVEVYHDGSFVTYAKVENGYISYEVSHFCEVEIKAAEEVVLDNTIDSVKEFIAFAEAVNAGNSYAGKTVVLGADLDLNGVTWTPIGTSASPFKGTFDGNGKVIKNLSVLMAGKSNVGLFGFTTDGEIKNVTVENAKVAGRTGVGVVAGQPYTTKYTNITVKGHVEVDGLAYVGAVGGRNAYADWTDITVNVDETSYVNGYSVENGSAYRTYVGGVVGFNGEGAHTFKNITTNINVIGSTCDVGGAFGIAHYGNKFENVTVTGTVTCTDATTEIGGVIGVWHNENGYTVTLTNCKYEGKSNVALTGSAYKAAGTGKLIVDGVEVAASAKTLQAQLDAGKTDIALFCDIVGDVTVTQAPNVQVTINGNGYTYEGVITVDGKSGTYTTAALTIKNVNFDGKTCPDADEYPDAYIRLGDGTNATRYTCNVTVEKCTFNGTDKTMVGVKSYTGGDKNVTITGCTAAENVHSLCQLKGVDGVLVENCKVFSKNGMNFNNSDNVVVNNCEVNVKGYTVRFGESKGGSGAAETYTIKNSKLTTNDSEGDAAVVLRGTADNATLTIENTSITGATKIANTATNAKVYIDGAAVVSTADELVAALEAKKDVVFANDITMKAATTNGYGVTGIVVDGQTINGNGYTLKVTGAGSTWDSAIYIKGGKIENLKITGAMRGVFMGTANADVYLENVSFGTIYTFNSDGGNTNYGVYISNSTMNGWTSHSNVHKEVVYTNCTFTEGSGYKFCRPYGPTKFVDCTFTAGFTVDKGQTSAITFENCTFEE